MKLDEMLELIDSHGINRDAVQTVSPAWQMIWLDRDEFRRVFLGRQATQNGRTLYLTLDGVKVETVTEQDDCHYREVTL